MGSTHSKKGLAWIPRWGIHMLHVSLWLTCRCYGFRIQSKDMPSAELEMLGANVYVCSSVLRWTRDLSRVFPASHPESTGIAPPMTKGLKDE